MEHEFMIFPIKNPRGIEIRSAEDYKDLIYAIAAETVNLTTEFPDKVCWVVYETENEGTN